MTGFAPGVEIYRELARVATPASSRLPAYMFGPAADVFEYIEGDVNVGKLGQYDPTPSVEVEGINRNVFTYPEKRVGGTVDLDTVKLHVTNGLFRYFSDTSNNVVKKSANTLYVPGHTLKTGNGYTVSSTVGARGVVIGDRVQVRATLPGPTPFVLNTHVVGFVGDAVAASVGSVTPGSANAVDHVSAPAATITPTAGVNAANTDIPGSVHASGYNGTQAARLSETYTIIALTTMPEDEIDGCLFSVTSADGQDNIASFEAGSDGVIDLGARGATATLTLTSGDQITAGDKWVVVIHSFHTAPTVAVTGTYTGTVAQLYIIEVVLGGEFEDEPVVIVKTQSGQDQSSQITLVRDDDSDVSEPVDLGSFGLSFIIEMPEGIVTGDRWSVLASPAGEGRYRTVRLAHSLPSAMVVDTASYSTEVDFMIRRSVELPRTVSSVELWSPRAGDVLVEAGIEYTFSDVTEAGGSLRSVPLVAPYESTIDSQIEIAYRVWHPRSTGPLTKSASTVLSTAIDGPTSVDNPLKLALSLADGEASGVPTLYYCVGDPSVEDNWAAALLAVEQTRSAYGLVPLTADPTILSLVNAHCVSRSTPQKKLYRVFWGAPTIASDTLITGDEDVLLATIIDDPDVAGTQYTLVQFSEGHIDLLETGVRAGDVLRYDFSLDAFGETIYSTAVIDSVVNSDTLKLATPGAASAELIARKVEIYRVYSVAEQVTAAQAVVAAYGAIARIVMPSFMIGTQEVDGFYLCAMLATRRSAYLPHRPMTNTDVNGLTGLVWETRFGDDELNSLAEAGFFLLKQDPMTGTITVRHAITAGDYSNVLEREESYHSNLDDISFQMDDQLKPFYGRLNANEETINRLNVELEALAGRLLAAGIANQYGPQVISMTIDDIRVLVGSKDTIVIYVTIEGPVPANLIKTYLYAT